jgi:hypothetical protein
MILNIRKPMYGETREKTKVALLPIRINDNTIIWLQKYKIEYRFEYNLFWGTNTWHKKRKWIEKIEKKERNETSSISNMILNIVGYAAIGIMLVYAVYKLIKIIILSFEIAVMTA